MSTKKRTSARTSSSARPASAVESVRTEQSNSPFRAQGLADELKEIIERKLTEARKQQNRLEAMGAGPRATGFYTGRIDALVELRVIIRARERKQARARNDKLTHGEPNNER